MYQHSFVRDWWQEDNRPLHPSCSDTCGMRQQPEHGSDHTVANHVRLVYFTCLLFRPVSASCMYKYQIDGVVHLLLHYSNKERQLSLTFISKTPFTGFQNLGNITQQQSTRGRFTFVCIIQIQERQLSPTDIPASILVPPYTGCSNLGPIAMHMQKHE